MNNKTINKFIKDKSVNPPKYFIGFTDGSRVSSSYNEIEILWFTWVCSSKSTKINEGKTSIFVFGDIDVKKEVDDMKIFIATKKEEERQFDSIFTN